MAIGDRSKEMLAKLQEQGVVKPVDEDVTPKEPQPEPVAQPEPVKVEENTPPPPQADTEEDSSLKEEKQPSEPVQVKKPDSDGFGTVVDLNEEKKEEVVEIQSQFSENDALSYINEKFGKSFESIDDVKFGTEDPLSQISEQALALDKFLKETGRNPLEWLDAQLVDYERLTDEQAIIVSLTQEGYTQSEAMDLYNAKYKAQEISEDLLDDEVATIKRENRLREIERNAKARESKKSLMNTKEKYSTPMEGWKPVIQETKNEFTSEVKEAFSKQASEVLDSLKNVDVPIADGKVYRVSMEKYLSENSETFSDPEKFIASKFKDANGNWDAEKMIRAAMYEENFKNISEYSIKNAFQMGQQEQSSHGRNLNFDSSDPKRGNHASETEAQKKFKKEMEEVKTRMGRNRGMKIRR